MTRPQIVEQVLDRMAESGWLRSPASIEDGTIELEWTVQGARDLWLLKVISDSYSLQSPEALIAFDIRCHWGHDVPGDSIPISEAVANFWRVCIERLKLPRSKEFLGELVHIAAEWAPSDKSRLPIE
ncbi:MAG: hypothetical protein V4819_25945 [Verrucomicrobiota bacterium]